MPDKSVPVWKVQRVTDTSKLQAGEYLDYRDIEVRIHNGDIIHVLIPTQDFNADTAASEIAKQVFEIVNTLHLQSNVTVAELPKYEVDADGNVNMLQSMEEMET